MIQLHAEKNCLTVVAAELLTSGSVNVNTVSIEFSADWEGLSRVAVFASSTTQISIALDSTNQCMIPWECLVAPNLNLRVGVYGMQGTTIVLPTIWASLGIIRPGVTTGAEPSPPTPDAYQKVLAEIGNLDELKTGNKDSLVGAINEIYETGGGEPLPEITEDDDGKFLGVLDGKPQWVFAGSGSGNVSSPDVGVIRVLDQKEYDELPEKEPKTLYFIRG